MTVNPRRFYVYAYMRTDGSPYYIGKGTGRRIHHPNHCVAIPPIERRVVLAQSLTNEEAQEWEVDLISLFRRKVDGGILRNLTLGGEGALGHRHTPEHKAFISQHLTEYWAANPLKRKALAAKAAAARKRAWNAEKAERLAAARRGKKAPEAVKQKMKASQAKRRAKETPEQRMAVYIRAAATRRANAWDARLVEMGYEVPTCLQERARLIDRIKQANARRAKGVQIGVRKGEAVKIARLTEDGVRIIRSSSESATALAKQLGVSLQTVCNVRNGKAWTHVTPYPTEAP